MTGKPGGGQRRIAWVLLLASAAAVLVTGLFGIEAASSSRWTVVRRIRLNV